MVAVLAIPIRDDFREIISIAPQGVGVQVSFPPFCGGIGIDRFAGDRVVARGCLSNAGGNNGESDEESLEPFDNRSKPTVAWKR